MLEVMYGMMPRLKMLNRVRAPPLKRFRKLRTPPLCDCSCSWVTRSKLIPGTGMWDPSR